MKKMMVFVLAMICILALVGCGKTEQTVIEETKPAFEVARVPREEAAEFSYEEDAAVYLSDGVEFNGETEVKQNGFYNITKCDVQDTVEAYERAKMECSISYDRVSVFYDNVGLTLSYSFLELPYSKDYRKDTVQAEMKVSACTFFIFDGRKENGTQRNAVN